MKGQSFIITLLLLFNCPAFSQTGNYDQSVEAVAARLKKDVSILASDSLEGREAATKGEAMAKEYIIARFKEIGLQPLFENGTSWVQPFDVEGPARYGKNSFSINGKEFKFKDDYYPVDFSANGKFKGQMVKAAYGISAKEMNYDDYNKAGDIKEKIVVMELYISDSLKNIPGFKNYEDPKLRVKTAIDKGAKAVVFVNSDPAKPDPPGIISGNTKPVLIPVIFADKKAAKLIGAAANMKGDIETVVKREKSDTAYNIGGYIDNKAKFTVVIGAHYDHLGYSTTSSGKKTVNNGADDNASGTAAMIENARFFSDTAKENYNFVFLAFSAEEKGLYGSEYFVESNAVDLSKVAFMINFDMVGRLDSIKKELTLCNAASSPVWKKTIAETAPEGIKIMSKESVESGSDHYNFYRKNIPALFFFTGLHSDYHKPADDIRKINFIGEAQIIKYFQRFFVAVNSSKKLPFVRASVFW